MECDISAFNFHIVVGFLLGYFIGICCCGYNQFKCRKDFERSLEEQTDKLSDSKQIELEELEERLLMTTVCACKPEDYPRCLLED